MKHYLLSALLFFTVASLSAQDGGGNRRQRRPSLRPRNYLQRPPSDPATADTEGNHVNAHGGCIIAYGDEWLWYGEARPARGFTSEGVGLYVARRSSEQGKSLEQGPQTQHALDSLEWENKGIVLAVVDSAGSPIERGCIIERPKVLWNERTQQFVMIFHSELKGRGYEAAQTGFATSSSPYGPFQFHHAQRPNANIWPADFKKKDVRKAQSLKESDFPKSWTPEWIEAVARGMYLKRDLEAGQMSRDMTLFVDDDGTAWHIYSSEENMTLQAAELTPDYLGYTGRYYRIAAAGQNEAPCILKRDGRYWLICSGCTGWTPNEARMFSAEHIEGPWTQHPSPMRGENAEKTFGGQGTWIWQPSPGKYFFMADVWNPRNLLTSRHLCIPITFDADGTPIVERK
ncbi:MAG: glycoside hydrolase family 43 protein [Bacteroidaceae bacterium]|nr:glycoside hydrolase family 43 protein [Bacteroidaceae bacterium]